MNILFLCDEYPPGRHGGIGTAVQLLGRELVTQGHNVAIAGFYDWGYGEADEFTDEGVKVYRFRRKLASSIFRNPYSLTGKILYKLFKLTGIFHWDIKESLKKYKAFIDTIVEKHKIDIIERPDYNDYMRFCKSYLPIPALPIPVIVKLHGSLTYFLSEDNKPVPGHIRKMEVELLRQATAVASVSKYTAEKTAGYLNYDKEIEILYNGIKPPEQKYPDEKLKNRVVFTGSLAAKKGIYQLMKAWNIVNTKLPEAELWIFGKGPVEKISSLLNAGAVKTVSFKGHVKRTELFHQIVKSSVAIFPSYAECFALAPMEAMACATAVIYTKRSSGRELIEDNIDGLLVDPDNTDEIADKILYLLTHAVERKRLGMKGKEKVLSKFDIRIITQMHILYYSKIIK